VQCLCQACAVPRACQLPTTCHCAVCVTILCYTQNCCLALKSASKPLGRRSALQNECNKTYSRCPAYSEQIAVASQASYATVALTVDGGVPSQSGHPYDVNGIADFGGIAGIFHQGVSALDFSYITWTKFENDGVSVLDSNVRFNTFRVLLPLPVCPRAVGLVVSANHTL
jgi:hypothetical protein